MSWPRGGPRLTRWGTPTQHRPTAGPGAKWPPSRNVSLVAIQTQSGSTPGGDGRVRDAFGDRGSGVNIFSDVNGVDGSGGGDIAMAIGEILGSTLCPAKESSELLNKL